MPSEKVQWLKTRMGHLEKPEMGSRWLRESSFELEARNKLQTQRRQGLALLVTGDSSDLEQRDNKYIKSRMHKVAESHTVRLRKSLIWGGRALSREHWKP